MQSFSVYLDFLISVVFIIALCSIILSIVYEVIAYYLRSRSYFLKKVIEEVLNDTVHAKINLTELFYIHPQVDLTKKTYRHFPAYISSKNFAQTLVDTLCNKHIRDNTFITSDPTHPAQITNALGDKVNNKFELFSDAVQHLGYCDLQVLLKGFITNAEGNLDKLYQNIIDWYDEYMNRVSGWYKTKVQKNLFFLALALCIALNFNFFRVTDTLMKDKALSKQIADIAERSSLSGADSIADATQLNDALQRKARIIDSLYKMNAPVLWYNVDRSKLRFGDVLRMIPGWIVMALLLTFGSPFWFDLLGKLVNLRKTGIKPLPSDNPSTTSPPR